MKVKTNGERQKLTLFTASLLFCLALYTVCLIVPLLWAVMTSFKSGMDYDNNVLFFPKEIVWNYTKVFQNFILETYAKDGATLYVGVGQMFANSLLYAVGCAFFATATPCITAYLCANYHYKLSKIVYYVVIVAMIIPIVGSMPSEIQMARMVGVFDEVWGLWIMKANFLGMYFLVFHSIFKAMPKAYSEAASIDGASDATILFKIALPLVKTTFFTVMLILFVQFWNDYQVPKIYMPSYPTISFGLFAIFKEGRVDELTETPMLMAATMLMILPILAIFLAFQKKFMGNLTVGGIKG